MTPEQQIENKIVNGGQLTDQEKSYVLSKANDKGLLDQIIAIDYDGINQKLSTGANLSDDDYTALKDGESRSYDGGTDVAEGIDKAATMGLNASTLAGVSVAPGVGTAAELASDIAHEVDTKEAMTNFGVNVTQDVLGTLGPVGSVASGLLGVATSEDPAKAATSTALSVAGSLLGGPIGGLVGGVLGSMAYDSYTDGYLGDAMDSRTDEGARDRAENAGYDHSETAAAAAVDADAAKTSADIAGLETESGYKVSPGLEDIDPYDKYSNALSEEAENGYDDGPSDTESGGSGKGDPGEGGRSENGGVHGH